jgi:integrase
VVTCKDKHGTLTKQRRNGKGPALDRSTAKYYAVVENVWSRSFRTKREAEVEERRMKGKADDGVQLGRDRITLVDFINTVWLPDARQRVELHSLDENTLENNEVMIDAHIVPCLGDKKLCEIKPATLQQFYLERKKTRGWKGTSSMINVHSLVSNILTLAVDRDHLAKNPAKAKGVRPKDRNAQPAREPVALTPDEARVMLAATDNDRLAAAWRLILLSGLRRGEALGLEWSDIDFKTGRVQLQRTWKTLVKSRRDVLGPIKTGKPRTITIDERTLSMLRAHRTQQAEERLAAGEVWNDLDVVFATELGERIRPDTFSDTFKRLLTAAVREGHLHELRHTAVTWAVNAGVPIHVAAERFGHSPSVMLSIYAHAQRKEQDEAADTLAAVIDV